MILIINKIPDWVKDTIKSKDWKIDKFYTLRSLPQFLISFSVSIVIMMTPCGLCHRVVHTDKYFVMTEDTEEHIGFMNERVSMNGEKYFEILIFDPDVEKELLLYRNIRERRN